MKDKLTTLRDDIRFTRFQHGDCELAFELEKWISYLDNMIELEKPYTPYYHNAESAEHANREVHAIQIRERE